MLLEDAEDETLAHDLKKLLDATARLLAQIDTLVRFYRDVASRLDDR